MARVATLIGLLQGDQVDFVAERVGPLEVEMGGGEQAATLAWSQPVAPAMRSRQLLGRRRGCCAGGPAEQVDQGGGRAGDVVAQGGVGVQPFPLGEA